MKSSATRIAHYDARMVSSLVDPVVAATAALAKANFAVYANEFVPKQVQLRAILDALGVPTIIFAGYEAFNGEMYHVYKTTAGASAIAMGVILCTKYEAWGLAAATLRAISLDLYNITVPV